MTTVYTTREEQCIQYFKLIRISRNKKCAHKTGSVTFNNFKGCPEAS